MPAVTAGKFDGAATADLAGLHREDFTDADGLHHRQRRIETTFYKRLNLLDGAFLHHLRKALVDPRIGIGTRRHDGNRNRLSFQSALMGVGLPCGDRPTRGPHDTHRTDKSLAVPSEKPRGSLLIEL